MPKTSAGLLMFRRRSSGIEVLLARPGGPYFKNKDEGVWSIPKGEIDAGEEMLAGAIREFEEETGVRPQGPFLPLGTVQQKGGKTVHAWAFEGDCDPERVRSNSFEMEWPPRSGKLVQFAEVDRVAFYTIEAARAKLIAAQQEFLVRLLRILQCSDD